MKARHFTRALLGSVFLVALAGCNSTPTTAEAGKQSAETKSEPAKEARQQDYVRVNSMGSWIPRKVKKQSDLIGDSTKTAEAGALQKVQETGLANTVRDGSR